MERMENGKMRLDMKKKRMNGLSGNERVKAKTTGCEESRVRDEDGDGGEARGG